MRAYFVHMEMGSMKICTGSESFHYANDNHTFLPSFKINAPILTDRQSILN